MRNNQKRPFFRKKAYMKFSNLFFFKQIGNWMPALALVVLCANSLLYVNCSRDKDTDLTASEQKKEYPNKGPIFISSEDVISIEKAEENGTQLFDGGGKIISPDSLATDQTQENSIEKTMYFRSKDGKFIPLGNDSTFREYVDETGKQVTKYLDTHEYVPQTTGLNLNGEYKEVLSLEETKICQSRLDDKTWNCEKDNDKKQRRWQENYAPGQLVCVYRAKNKLPSGVKARDSKWGRRLGGLLYAFDPKNNCKVATMSPESATLLFTTYNDDSPASTGDETIRGNTGSLLSNEANAEPVGTRGDDGCFDGNVKILMGDGSSKAIKLIRSNDYVLNPVTGQKQKVKQVVKGPENNEMILIGHGSGSALVTKNHPFVTKRGVLKAKDLNLRDLIQTPDKKWIQVAILKQMPIVKGQIVWNIELESIHKGNEHHMILANSVVTGDLWLQKKLAKKDIMKLAVKK